MYLKFKIICLITFVFLGLVSLISYFFISEGQKIIKASNKKFRFSNFVSAIVFGIFISILMLIPLLMIFGIKQKINSEIILGLIFILFIITGIFLIKIIFIPSKRKKVFNKLKAEVINSTEYKIKKSHCYFQGIIGVITMGYFLLIGDSNFSYAMNIIIGIIAMVAGLIKLIRGLKVPKVITNKIYIKHNVNFFLTQFLKWEEVDHIKAKKGLLGIKSITIINYQQDSKKNKRKTYKKMVISNLENMKELIEEIIKRTNNVVLDEKLKNISNEIKNYKDRVFSEETKSFKTNCFKIFR